MAQHKHRIFIAECETLMREGLRAMLGAHPEFEVVGEARAGPKGLPCRESFAGKRPTERILARCQTENTVVTQPEENRRQER
jgi:hypothetical protein